MLTMCHVASKTGSSAGKILNLAVEGAGRTILLLLAELSNLVLIGVQIELKILRLL